MSRSGLRATSLSPTVRHWTPQALLQLEQNDCGLAAAVALAAMYGHEICPRGLRSLIGSVERGLTIRQVRDLLRFCGFGAEVATVTRDFIRDHSEPFISLSNSRHYIIVGKRHRGGRRVFDPGRGWRHTPLNELQQSVGSYIVFITDVPTVVRVPIRSHVALRAWLRGFRLLPYLTAIVAATAVAQIFALGVPWLTGNIVDNFGVAHDGYWNSTGLVGIAGFAIAALFSILVGWICAELTARFKRHLTEPMLSRITGNALGRPLSQIRKEVPELLAARICSISNARSFVADQLPAGVLHLALASGALIVTISVSPILATIAVVGALLRMIVEQVTQNRALSAQEREFWMQAQYRQRLSEAIRSVHVLHAYAATKSMIERLAMFARRSAGAEFEAAQVTRHVSTAQSVIEMTDRALFLLLGSALIGYIGITAGSFFALMLYRETLVSALDGLRRTYAGTKRARIATNRIEDLMTDAPSMKEGANAGPIDACNKAAVGAKAENINFRFNIFSPSVISNFTLNIKPGQKVVIVGSSGSGKSTLARLIAGALEPTSGSILIYGFGGVSWKPADFQANIGYAMQDDCLCAGSILENIDMFRGHSIAQIEEAAAIVEMHEVILSMPSRYDTSICDDVQILSGGQRQRLLLARAICGNARILVLDEATSNIDLSMERRIQKRLQEQRITQIIFSHRPESLKDADQVIDLDLARKEEMALAS